MPSTNPQVNEALRLANERKWAQNDLKRELYTGEVTLEEALADERVTSNTTVEWLLCWQFRWGIRAARRVCKRADIRTGKLVRDLSPRQVYSIVEEAAKEPGRGRTTRIGSKPKRMRKYS